MLSNILAEKFRHSSYINVKEWKDATRCALSTETITRVILRGVEPGIPIFMIKSLGA